MFNAPILNYFFTSFNLYKYLRNYLLAIDKFNMNKNDNVIQEKIK